MAGPLSPEDTWDLKCLCCLFMFTLPETPFPCLVVYVNPTPPSRSGSHFKYLLRKLCLTFIAVGRKDVSWEMGSCSKLLALLFLFFPSELLAVLLPLFPVLFVQIYNPSSRILELFRIQKFLERFQKYVMMQVVRQPAAIKVVISAVKCMNIYLCQVGAGQDFTINELQKCFDFQICLTFGRETGIIGPDCLIFRN